MPTYLQLALLERRRSTPAAELCRALGVGKNSVKDWLDGTRRPREATLQRLAEVLGEPVDRLADATELDPPEAGLVPPLGRVQVALDAVPSALRSDAVRLLDAVAAMLERAAGE